MLSGALLLLVAGAKPVIVAEAVVHSQEGDPAIGAEIARSLGALDGGQAAHALAQRLPPVGAVSKAEPVIEADRLVESGRDAYVEGKFKEAVDQLQRARDVLNQAVESLEEERKAAEILFRAHMYLAFTLRSAGGNSMPQAVEAMKEAIRTFPGLEPSYSEYGPENVRFYRQVKAEMEQTANGNLHVRSIGESANVYLNGRLVGVTPLDLRKIYTGHYLLHLRRGTEPTRLHAIEIKAGDNEVRVDLPFEQALRTDRGVSLAYDSDDKRRAGHRRHAAQVARLLDASGTLVWWPVGPQMHLVFVDLDGNARWIECAPSKVATYAAGLRDGTAGEFVKSDFAPRRRVWTWVAAGVGGTALVAGVVLGISAHSDFNSLNDKYPNGGIPANEANTRDGGANKQLAANVLFGVAGAAAVTSALLYYYEGKHVDAKYAVTPIVGPQFAGAQWQVRF